MPRKKHFQIHVFTRLMYYDSKGAEVEVRTVFETSSVSVVWLLHSISMAHHISGPQSMIHGRHGDTHAV